MLENASPENFNLVSIGYSLTLLPNVAKVESVLCNS